MSCFLDLILRDIFVHQSLHYVNLYEFIMEKRSEKEVTRNSFHEDRCIGEVPRQFPYRVGPDSGYGTFLSLLTLCDAHRKVLLELLLSYYLD